VTLVERQRPGMRADEDGQRRVPLTVLTGFLGAGKTTLLNRILCGDHGLRVAVLVNDFGSINIDAELVVGVDDDIISLANGCVCCSVRDDLVDAVARVLDRPERPQYVLLEASGVADPASIASTFMVPDFHERIRLDSITCVVDAEQFFAVPELMELKLWQIGCADLLILNKVDLAGHEEVAKIKSWLDGRFRRYRLLEASHCEVPLEVLLAVGRFDPAQIDGSAHQCAEVGTCDHESHHRGHDGGHGSAFSTASFETNTMISLEDLKALVKQLPGAIYRLKGIVWSTEAPDRRAVVQVVGKRMDISFDGSWRHGTPQTRLVAIGAPGSVDASLLDDLLAPAQHTVAP